MANSTDQLAEERKQILDWADRPIKAYYRWYEEAATFYAAAVRGLLMVSNLPELTKALMDLPARLQGEIYEGKDIVEEEELTAAEDLGAFAKSEASKGFPTLHSHLILSHWSALQAYVEDTVIEWLQNVPDSLQAQEIRRLKIRFSDYHGLTDQEQLRYIVDRLKSQMPSQAKRGAGQFEAVLSIVGLGGSLESEQRRNLLELAEVRNVLAHRRGVADARLVKGCPWLTLAIDDKIEVSAEQFNRLASAAFLYGVEILHRKYAILELPWE